LGQWAVRAFYDATIAFFTGCGLKSSGKDIMLALEDCTATLKTAGLIMLNNVKIDAGKSVAIIVLVIDVIGQAIQKADNLLELATVLASLCLRGSYKFKEILLPSIRSNMLWILVYTSNQWSWLEGEAFLTLQSAWGSSSTEVFERSKWIERSKDAAKENPLKVML
jgi:hypothetical protein